MYNCKHSSGIHVQSVVQVQVMNDLLNFMQAVFVITH